jgi:hypothetical protein
MEYCNETRALLICSHYMYEGSVDVHTIVNGQLDEIKLCKFIS